MSGSRPSPLRAWTVVCVGFVFCSPCISGTRETWMSAKLSVPTRNWNCLIASMNGADSISPTVPPSLSARSTIRRGQVPGRRYLDYADISFLLRLIHGNLRNTLDPILDRVRDMRHNLVGVSAESHPFTLKTRSHLYSLTEVVPTALTVVSGAGKYFICEG